MDVTKFIRNINAWNPLYQNAAAAGTQTVQTVQSLRTEAETDACPLSNLSTKLQELITKAEEKFYKIFGASCCDTLLCCTGINFALSVFALFAALMLCKVIATVYNMIYPPENVIEIRAPCPPSCPSPRPRPCRRKNRGSSN